MWNPKEVRSLITQISGILFGLGGIALMIAGVKVTGKINISSSILSGEIESGSAGLLMLFLSFFLIALPGLTGKYTVHHQPALDSTTEEAGQKSPSNAAREIRKGTAATLLGTILTFSAFIGGQHLSDKYQLQIGGFLIFLGYVFGVLTTLVLLGLVYGYLTDFKPDDDSNQNQNQDPPSA